MTEDLCSIGINLKEKCNFLLFNRSVGRYQIDDLTEGEKTLLNIRTQKTFSYNLIFVIIMKINVLIDTNQLKNIVKTLLNYNINALLNI